MEIVKILQWIPMGVALSTFILQLHNFASSRFFILINSWLSDDSLCIHFSIDYEDLEISLTALVSSLRNVLYTRTFCCDILMRTVLPFVFIWISPKIIKQGWSFGENHMFELLKAFYFDALKYASNLTILHLLFVTKNVTIHFLFYFHTLSPNLCRLLLLHALTPNFLPRSWNLRHLYIFILLSVFFLCADLITSFCHCIRDVFWPYTRRHDKYGEWNYNATHS
jgi:hypothetical protein